MGNTTSSTSAEAHRPRRSLREDARHPGQFARISCRVHPDFTRPGILVGMNTETGLAETFKRPSAFLPIVMSLVAIAILVVHLAIPGPAPQSDEGPAAHLWQLLMAGQVPIVAFFLIRWVTKAPRSVLTIFALQISVALAALAPVYLLKW